MSEVLSMEEFKRLVNYEIAASLRYRRPFSLVMLRSGDSEWKVLDGLLRDSDAHTERDDFAFVLMTETQSPGALQAAERYRGTFNYVKKKAWFSVTSFPKDADGTKDVFEIARKRLETARTGEVGAIVTSG